MASGPWEKYQQPSSGPWEKYQAKPDDGLLDMAGKTVLTGLGMAAETIDRLGPAQARNAFAGTIGMKPENMQSYIEDVTGKNAPSWSAIFDYMGIPKENINLGAKALGAENLQGFKTSPQLPEQEQKELSGVKIMDTNDLLGAVMDFKSSDQAVKNIGSMYGKAKGALTRQAPIAQQAENVSSGQLNLGPSESIVESKGYIPKQPGSLKEVLEAKIPEPKMVAKERMAQIAQEAPDIQIKPLKYHEQMLENPTAMQELKLKFENLPSETKKKLAQYDLAMVNESADKIKQTVGSFTKDAPKSLSDAGQGFIDDVAEKYAATKQELTPAFKAMKEQAIALSPDEAKQVILKIGEDTKVGKLLKLNPENGAIYLDKFDPAVGLSKSEYGAAKEIIGRLNKGVDFEQIQNIREYLRKLEDPINFKSTAEISKIRGSLLNSLEDMTPGEVRPVFKQYAINEKALENVEKVIGGKIEDLNKLYNANPDRVVQKIFSNPNNVEVVKSYVGEDPVKKMIQSFMQKGIEDATDSVRGFSPEKFRNWLDSDFTQKTLSRYAPEEMKRLSALADHGYLAKRFMDKVNPSGTALALQNMFDYGDIVSKIRSGGVKGFIEGEVAQKTLGKLKERGAIKAVEQALGNAPAASKTVLDTNKLWQKAGEMVKGAGTAAVAQNVANPRSKFEQTGIKNLKDAGLDEDLINSLPKQQLEEASSYKKDSPQMDKFIKKIKSANPDLGLTFPTQVKKNGYVAQVSNKRELDEAKSEGWKHELA